MSAVEFTLRRVADSMFDLPFEAWHFGDSVAFEGLLAASDATGDPRYWSFAHGFSRGWLARTAGAFRPLDCTAAGTAMCRIAQSADDELLASGLVQLAEYLIARPKMQGIYQTWAQVPLREPYGGAELSAEEQTLLDDAGAGAFVDCLHFDPPFFAQLSRLTGDRRWAREAVQQATAYVDVLQDPESGLFHHFALAKTGRRYIPRWGRGQGWALLGLLEVAAAIDDVPTSIFDSINSLIAGMVDTQRPDGHWDAVVGLAASGRESSTAAFMATGFRRAMRLGIATDPSVATTADRAAEAVHALIDDRGHLADVSVAVWACTDESHYTHVPRGVFVPWGQGPAALMLAEQLQSHTATA